jgi:hypothetical protein
MKGNSPLPRNLERVSRLLGGSLRADELQKPALQHSHTHTHTPTEAREGGSTSNDSGLAKRAE